MATTTTTAAIRLSIMARAHFPRAAVPLCRLVSSTRNFYETIVIPVFRDCLNLDVADESMKMCFQNRKIVKFIYLVVVRNNEYKFAELAFRKCETIARAK